MMAAARSAASRRPGARAGRGHPSSSVTVLGVPRGGRSGQGGRLRRSPGSLFYGSLLHTCLICYQGSLVRQPRLPAAPVPRTGRLEEEERTFQRLSKEEVPWTRGLKALPGHRCSPRGVGVRKLLLSCGSSAQCPHPCAQAPESAPGVAPGDAPGTCGSHFLGWDLTLVS